MIKYQTVNVNLEQRSYNIYIGVGLLAHAGKFLSEFSPNRRVAIITDTTIAPLHLADLHLSCANYGLELTSLHIPTGEASKSWQYLQTCVEWLLEQKIERTDLVVSFGGGVIGDLVGFAAAILRRGVNFAQIPTSLLGQVDSAIGGKTAINSPYGKNLIGVFYQPKIVLSDIKILSTLPKRDFIAGYSEVVKYALLADADFFTWLEKNAAAIIAGDEKKRTYAVRRCCQIKADIVANDETERGNRALLNLGHTFCHPLENATGYSRRLLHGEAVSIGCILAFEVSVRLGLCSRNHADRVRAHLQKMGMKTTIYAIGGDLPQASYLLELMEQDKKVKNGRIHFILLRAIGKAIITDNVDRDVVVQVLQDSLVGVI